MQTSLLLAVAAFGTSVFAAPAACTRTAVAKSGDTCATFSSANAITVTQFLQNNPTLPGCSLTAGYAYCVAVDGAAGTYTPTLVSTASSGLASSTVVSSSSGPQSSPTGTLIPSPDGSEGVCGGQYTCSGSVYGDCCSANGYCGNTTDYCGTGCNTAFGSCGGGTAPDEGGNGTVTVTVTSVPTGGAVTVSVTHTASGTTVTSTVTQTAAGTTVVSIVTSIATATKTVTGAVTATATTTASATATGVSSAKPSPILPGSYAKCTQYYQLKRGDTCRAIGLAYGASTADLEDLNPQLNCLNTSGSVGYYVCVAY